MTRALSFRRMMALVATGAVCLVGLLAAGFVVGADRSARLQALADTAQRQAMMVTRIEADLAGMLLAAPLDRVPARRALSATLGVYRATIAAERALIGDDPAARAAQDREAVHAARLAMLVAAERFGPARALAQRIARVERGEADRAAQAIARVRADVARRGAMMIALVLSLLAGVGWTLWRQVIRPIGALAQATRRLAAEQPPARVPVRGLAELRDLAHRFNDMAGTIEAQVTARTAEIARANADLRAIDARRRLFFAKVGHELRTPVTVMRGEAEVALRHAGDDPAALSAALAQVRDNAGFLDRRIEDLLGIARAENGALALDHRPVDLGAIVREAGALAEPFARANGIALRVDAAAGVPVRGDAQWLRQAMLTVLDNAVKFSPPDGCVTLTLATHDGAARVAVIDEGAGVATGELDAIFDAYAQGQGGRARGGAGLGLSLARWIADQHHGAIRATPAAGRGLCVAITLPVLQ